MSVLDFCLDKIVSAAGVDVGVAAGRSVAFIVPVRFVVDIGAGASIREAVRVGFHKGLLKFLAARVAIGGNFANSTGAFGQSLVKVEAVARRALHCAAQRNRWVLLCIQVLAGVFAIFGAHFLLPGDDATARGVPKFRSKFLVPKVEETKRSAAKEERITAVRTTKTNNKKKIEKKIKNKKVSRRW